MTTTEIFFGARSDEWAGTRPVFEHLEVHDLAPGNLFFVPDDGVANIVGGAPIPTTFAACVARITENVRDNDSTVTEVLPIGAVQRNSQEGIATAYLPVVVGTDLIFSRSDEQLGHDDVARALLACEEHVLLEVDLHKRAPDDLTFVEREIKLDAGADPRPAALRLRFGDGTSTFSGAPDAGVHFHRIYDIGPSGLFEMTSDPDGGPTLLKHKKDLGTPADPVYRRLEMVEPTTTESMRRVMAELDPSAEPSQVPVTPYFQRDRVRTNVYIAESRSVYVVYADHSAFLDGDYAPFDQIEIEYVGVVARKGFECSWGDASTPQLDAAFAAIQALVSTGYADAGLPLTPSRRRKYDWAVTEVFGARP